MIKIYPPTPSGTKEMFDDFEKGDWDRKEQLENAQDRSVELEVEATFEKEHEDAFDDAMDEKYCDEHILEGELEEAHEEKLASKAREDTEGEHPSVHGDSPGINAIGDERK